MTRRPLPVVGDVIRYAYLWNHEQDAGREDGTKDRPAAVVALVQNAEGQDEVVVLAVTSSPPTDPGGAVEISAATRARLGLQREPCWVVVSEYNIFEWPGPDLRPTERGTGAVVYGRMPPALLDRVQAAFVAWRRRVGPQRGVRRTE